MRWRTRADPPVPGSAARGPSGGGSTGVDNDLVDEMNLLVFPVVVGQGTRLFPDTGSDRALHLVGSRATPKGVTIQVYRPSGRPQYATATADLKHVRWVPR
jgi:RibD C-terminal domain